MIDGYSAQDSNTTLLHLMGLGSQDKTVKIGKVTECGLTIMIALHLHDAPSLGRIDPDVNQ